MKRNFMLSIAALGLLLTIILILIGCNLVLPSSPSGVKAVAVSKNSVMISWNEVPGAIEYKVYYGSSGNSNPVLSHTVKNTFMQHSLLSSDSTYFYKVSAINNAGEGSASKIISVTTPE